MGRIEIGIAAAAVFPADALDLLDHPGADRMGRAHKHHIIPALLLRRLTGRLFAIGYLKGILDACDA
jgi:hypothetical protein